MYLSNAPINALGYCCIGQHCINKRLSMHVERKDASAILQPESMVKRAFKPTSVDVDEIVKPHLLQPRKISRALHILIVRP